MSVKKEAMLSAGEIPEEEEVVCPLFVLFSHNRWHICTTNCGRKFHDIHATRWLLWHSDFTQFNFSHGNSAGELTMLPLTPNSTPSTPSVSHCLRLQCWSSNWHWPTHVSDSFAAYDDMTLCITVLCYIHTVERTSNCNELSIVATCPVVYANCFQCAMHQKWVSYNCNCNSVVIVIEIL